MRKGSLEYLTFIGYIDDEVGESNKPLTCLVCVNGWGWLSKGRKPVKDHTK